MKKVALIMGSKSDWPVFSKAADTLRTFDVPFTVHVMSAHRTPDDALSFAKTAAGNGYGVLIAAAGKAAHLAGVLASSTVLPVIGIPVKASALDGLDALLSVVQMPAGVPVATVAIDGAENAALLAVQMLALAEPALSSRLEEHKTRLAQAVRVSDTELKTELGL